MDGAGDAESDLADRDVVPGNEDALPDLDCETRFASDGYEAAPFAAEAIDSLATNRSARVSRVTANRYVAVPRGIYAMKYFFAAATASSAGGDDHSAVAVRHRIRELIDGKTPQSILSDDRIADSLPAQGVRIA